MCLTQRQVSENGGARLAMSPHSRSLHFDIYGENFYLLMIYVIVYEWEPVTSKESAIQTFSLQKNYNSSF